eukprot:s193_g31.t1
MVWKERVRVLKVKFPKIPKAFRARAAYQTTCTVPVKREKCVRLGELNPENLTPDSAEVKMDVLVGKLVDLPSKASRRRDRRARGLETMGRRWEYEARGAFKAFEDDCQGEVERLFQEYQSGGQQRVTVKTGKIEISLDFKLMTSKVVGSKTLTGLKMLSQRQCARTMRGAKGHEVLAILRVMCKVCLVKIDVGDPHESPSPMFVTFALAPYVYLFWLRHPSGYRHQPVADAQKATGVAKLQSLAEIIRVTTPESCNWLRGSHPQ